MLNRFILFYLYRYIGICKVLKMKFMKRKNNDNMGPRSSLGLLSFNEHSKSIIKLTPELIITISLVFGLFIMIVVMW